MTEQQIEQALSLLITIEKTVTEGAGAAGLAAVLADETRFKGRAVGLVLSGGNIDTRLLSSVLTRQLAREGRLSQLRFDIVDRPGQLATVVAVLGKSGANIVEVSHQRIFTDLPAKAVLLEVVIETRDRSHLLDHCRVEGGRPRCRCWWPCISNEGWPAAMAAPASTGRWHLVAVGKADFAVPATARPAAGPVPRGS